MNVSLFLESLPVMGKGMLGIFIVTGVIILLMVVLNKLPSKKEPPQND